MYLCSAFCILTYKIRMRDIHLLNISQCHFPFVFIGYFYAKNDILLFYPNYNNSSYTASISHLLDIFLHQIFFILMISL